VFGSDRDARDFVADLAAHRFPAALARCSQTMRAALPDGKLAAIWTEAEAAFGPLQGIDEARLSTKEEYRVVDLAARFGSTRKGLRVVFDVDGRVAGFFFVAVESAAAWQPPAYAVSNRFTEREVSVGSAPSLPGTLTLPTGSGPFPAVVLVHGSGPSDADETVGGVKMFKDLAWGLASKGVAVLRYVKRSRYAPAGVTTIKEEVLDGARAAVALLCATPEIDPKRVVVVGHSQGAELAPRIASESPGVEALVMMSPPSRPLQDVVLDQLTYLAKLQPGARAAALVEQARAFKAALDDPALDPDADVAFPGGGSMKGAYYRSMRGYDPVKSAAALSIPILILFGDRDYQVTAVDLDGFKRALGNRSNVLFKQYPADNHLFVGGSGTPRPEEYEEAPAHVDPQVIEDIAAFVTKRD
jgi:dienelactone hydrolase